MNQAIVKSYWRSLRRGTRTLAEVPAALRDAVRDLARLAAATGGLSAEEYERLTGEPGAQD